MPTTNNMSLELPVVGSTPGPDWADLLNQAFNTIDVHDHSDGKGVKVTPAGLNINANLDYNANEIINLKILRLNDITGDGVNGVYQNGGDLYWRNGAGNDVQITSGGTINVGSLGTIGGDYSTDPNNPLITFTTASGDYDFYKDTTGSPIPAGINSGILTIFEELAGTNGISIQSPASLIAAYNIILPPTQAATNDSLITVQGSGQWSYTRLPTANRIGLDAAFGTVSTPNIYNQSDPSTGRYFPAVEEISDTLGGIQSFLQTQEQHSLFFNALSGDRVGLRLVNPSSSIASFQIENSLGASDFIRLKNNAGQMLFEIDDSASFYEWYINSISQAKLDTTGLTLGIAGNDNTHILRGGQFFLPGDSANGSLANPGTSLFALGHRGGNFLLRQGESAGGTIEPVKINSNMDFNGTNYVTNTGGVWGTQLAIGANGGSATTPALEMLTSTGGTGDGAVTTIAANWRVTHAGATLGTNGSSSLVTFGFLTAQNSGMWLSSGGNLVFSRSGVDGFVLSDPGTPRLTPVADLSSNLGDPSFRWNNGHIANLTSSTINTTTLNATSIPTVNATTVNATTVDASGLGSFDLGVQAGSVSSPSLKWKALSPSFSGSPGGGASIVHGISPSSNIRYVTISGADASNNIYISTGSNGGGDVEVTSITSSNINYTHNVAALNSRTARITIFYV